jgi:hypothetical protein
MFSIATSCSGVRSFLEAYLTAAGLDCSVIDTVEDCYFEVVRDRTDQGNAGVDVTTLLPPPGQRSAPEVVDALATLLRVTLSASERTQCETYLSSQAGAGGVPTPSPFDASNATHVSERVRGLLYILAQHPTYAVR